MCTIERFIIRLTSLPDVGYTATYTSTKDAAWRHTRTIKMVTADEYLFPRAVEDERADLPNEGSLHYNLCVGEDTTVILQTHLNIINRQPREGEVEAFGRYLFDTLIGSDLWQEMCQKAADATLLEIALAWGITETSLHRLNWEMMHGPHQFLAALQPTTPREVAITRLVADAIAEPNPLHPIPRKLFVVGTHLGDESIRPGAEYLGLLRRLKKKGHPHLIQTRVLLNTSPLKLEDTIISFEPDVVQFICHGNLDDQGDMVLDLELALGDNELDDNLRRRTADQLHQFISAGSHKPSIVVLSACHSGTMYGAHQTAPLASQLVSLGTPIVIGMAGRISDSACRHFTRRFGEALVQKHPLVKATADGRRAAFAHGPSPKVSVDWTFPAVFLSENVPTNYPPASANDEALPIARWANRYNNDSGEPVFCGRYEFFEDFHSLFTPQGPTVLAAFNIPAEGGHKKLGKTRLLGELAVQAIQEAHLPITLLVNQHETLNAVSLQEPPRSLDDLRLMLVRALRYACTNIYDFDLPDWRLLDLSDITKFDNTKDKDIYQELHISNGKLTATAIKLALTIDLKTMLYTAINTYPTFFSKEHSRPILMLDDMHHYPLDILNEWFSKEVIGTNGLGDAETPIPLIFTFSKEGAGGAELYSKLEKFPCIQARRLEPFSETNDEDLLVYERVWLHPFAKIYPPVSDRPYAVEPPQHLSSDPMPEEIQKWESWKEWIDRARSFIKGHPINFKSENFYWLAQMGLDRNFFRVADDEKLLEEYREREK